MNVAAQETFHTLIEEELKVKRPRIGQCDYKAGKSASGAAYGNFPKMRPVNLPLFSWKSGKTKKGFPASRTDSGNEPSQLHDAAVETTVSDHVINPGRPQGGMFYQRLSNKVVIRVCNIAQRLGITEPLGFHGSTDSLGMKAQFMGNSPNFPVLCVKQVTNTCASLVVDQSDSPP